MLRGVGVTTAMCRPVEFSSLPPLGQEMVAEAIVSAGYELLQELEIIAHNGIDAGDISLGDIVAVYESS
jgi:hypothetical protein